MNDERTRRVRRLATLLVALGALALASCAHAPGNAPLARGLAWTAPPAADDSTVALFRLDESAGLAFEDDLPGHAPGAYGGDTQPTFGRFRSARRFTQSINSFAYVPPSTALELGPRWTIELWVNPSAYGSFEMSVLAARWTESANEQSWVLGIVGRDQPLGAGMPAPPDVFTTIVGGQPLGRIVFVLQPQGATPARAFVSTRAVDVGRWTHVGVTYDGAVLRFYLDGRLDAQYASTDGVRASEAPLVIGNLIDPRWLTRDQGPLRVDPALGKLPYFAFEGAIDDVRLSNVPRIPGTPHAP